MPKEFAAIELPDPVKKGAKNVTRKGKKPIPWNDDPEILKRLTRVAELMLDGKYAWEIAEELRTSIATAKRDIGRVRELWKTHALEKSENLFGNSLATYNRVQTRAWQGMIKNPEKEAHYMKIILEAQEKIDKIAGVSKPTEVNVTVNGAIEIKDIEQVRDERWEQVKDALKDVLTEGGK
jgi:hypothetical protein